MSVDLYTPIKGALDQLGYNNKVYTVPDNMTIPCPCTENPWHQYSEVWHLEHPDRPHCHKTGVLKVDGTEGYFEVETIWGLVIPHFAYTGFDSKQLVTGLDASWEWLGVTQSKAKFNRWINPAGMVFTVQAEMPYYVGGTGEHLTVALYAMTPLNKDVRIP